jgi:hypothetical protein
MYGLFLSVLAFVLRICCWLMGDCELRTKIIMTVLFVLMQGLVFISGWLLLAALVPYCAFPWWLTFGGPR